MGPWNMHVALGTNSPKVTPTADNKVGGPFVMYAISRSYLIRAASFRPKNESHNAELLVFQQRELKSFKFVKPQQNAGVFVCAA